ncbi:unnamed protein product, partial [Polarella glacialis]
FLGGGVCQFCFHISWEFGAFPVFSNLKCSWALYVRHDFRGSGANRASPPGTDKISSYASPNGCCSVSFSSQRRQLGYQTVGGRKVCVTSPRLNWMFLKCSHVRNSFVMMVYFFVVLLLFLLLLSLRLLLLLLLLLFLLLLLMLSLLVLCLLLMLVLLLVLVLVL